MRPERGYEAIAVGASVGVRAWAPTIAEAFAEAAHGVFARIVDPGRVDARETREVRAQGSTVEALLVTWINECLYVHEIEGFVVQRVDVDTCVGGIVHGTLHGEELDRDRHRVAVTVKAATFDGVEVTEGDAGFNLHVMLET